MGALDLKGTSYFQVSERTMSGREKEPLRVSRLFYAAMGGRGGPRKPTRRASCDGAIPSAVDVTVVESYQKSKLFSWQGMAGRHSFYLILLFYLIGRQLCIFDITASRLD